MPLQNILQVANVYMVKDKGRWTVKISKHINTATEVVNGSAWPDTEVLSLIPIKRKTKS